MYNDEQLRLVNQWPWFHGLKLNAVIPIQDPVHVGTKLRTRFLKREKFLPFGNKIASPSDIESLIKIVSKDKHHLRLSDLNLQDKMNFDAVQRLCSAGIRQLLKRHIIGIFKYNYTMFKGGLLCC